MSLRSKLAGKCLRTLEGGVLDCGGDQGSACEFDPLILVLITITLAHHLSLNPLGEYRVCPGSAPNTIKLQNVGQPKFYVALTNGYLIGYVRQ